MTTVAEAAQAERLAREQRMGFFPQLRMDESKAGADQDHCRRAFSLVESDPLKFDSMLSMPIIGRLFGAGALYFQRTA